MKRESNQVTEGLQKSRPTKTVRLWLDEDIVKFFKSKENYEQKINEILRSQMEAQKANR